MFGLSSYCTVVKMSLGQCLSVDSNLIGIMFKMNSACENPLTDSTIVTMLFHATTPETALKKPSPISPFFSPVKTCLSVPVSSSHQADPNRAILGTSQDGSLLFDLDHTKRFAALYRIAWIPGWGWVERRGLVVVCCCFVSFRWEVKSHFKRWF